MKYNYSMFSDGIEKVRGIFFGAFITLNDELILFPQENIYFRLDNIKSSLEFECKMIEYLSRPAHKGLSDKKQKKVRDKLNSYFGTTWGASDLSIIYTSLGNGVNRSLCMEFISSGFNLDLLKW